MPNNIPDCILLKVWKFLPIKELAIVALLSKKWKKVSNHHSFWFQALTLKKSQVQLDRALFFEIEQNKKPDLIRHYCEIGANVNAMFKTDIERKFSWFTTGSFRLITLLCLAANYASKENGEIIVRLLLVYGANKNIKSSSVVNYISDPFGLLKEMPPEKVLPFQVAANTSIRNLLK